MLESVLTESEKYSFPIITGGKTFSRNSEAKRIRSLSRVSPLSCLDKKTKERVSLLTENSVVAVKTKRGSALVYRRFGFLNFMFLPMLENVGDIPNDVFDLNVSGSNLPEVLSNLAQKLFPKGEMTASSFCRVASLSATLAFSEDTVRSELENDGLISVKNAFFALGQALRELDFKDATELSDPPITVSFSGDTLTVSLYGEELYTEKTRVLTAVAPYTFTEKEYSAAFVLAVATAIFKGRNQV